MPSDCLDAIGLAVDRSSDPLVVPWPMPGNLGGFPSFTTFAEWRRFVLQFSLQDSIPEIVAAKFERAQKLHLLAWIDFDLLKAGELVALTTLELALKDRYLCKEKERRSKLATEKAKKEKGAVRKKERLLSAKISFADLLKYMVTHDNLTDDQVPMNRRCGAGSVVGLLTGDPDPETGQRPRTLAEIRNELAHGDPFDGFPCAGLLELVRDLIDYAYRGWIAEAPGPLLHQTSASKSVAEASDL